MTSIKTVPWVHLSGLALSTYWSILEKAKMGFALMVLIWYSANMTSKAIFKVCAIGLYAVMNYKNKHTNWLWVMKCCTFSVSSEHNVRISQQINMGSNINDNFTSAISGVAIFPFKYFTTTSVSKLQQIMKLFHIQLKRPIEFAWKICCSNKATSRYSRLLVGAEGRVDNVNYFGRLHTTYCRTTNHI